MLETVSWDKESGCITCRAQNARDSVRTGKVREIWGKKRVEALVAEKRQLVMNSLRDGQPVEIFQSRIDVFTFPNAYQYQLVVAAAAAALMTIAMLFYML